MTLPFARRWLDETFMGAPCIGHLGADVLLDLNKRARWEHVDVGDILLTPDEWHGDLLFLSKGAARVTLMARPGHSAIVRVRKAPDVLLLERVLADRPSAANIEVVEPGCIGRLSRIAFLDLMERFPCVARAVAKELSERILSRQGEPQNMASAGARLAGALLMTAHTTGKDDRLELHEMPDMGVWATLLGIPPEQLAKELKRLQRIGALLPLSGGRFVVDADKLAQRAGGKLKRKRQARTGTAQAQKT